MLNPLPMTEVTCVNTARILCQIFSVPWRMVGISWRKLVKCFFRPHEDEEDEDEDDRMGV